MASETDLAKLVVKMEAQSEKYLRDLKKSREQTNKWRKKVGSDVAAVGKGFRRLAAAAGLGLMARAVVRNTQIQQKAMSQLQAGWKSTAGMVGRSVDEMAAEAARLQKVSLFGDEQIIEAQSILLTFTKITGDAFDRTTEAALDLSTRLGTDLKSSMIQLGKALNDPATGLSMLSRSGITFSETQKEIIKDLVKNNKLFEAQSVILDELETQFGGSAAAARDTFGGALTGLGNAFQDLLEGGDGKGGLREATEDINELTELLQDPATVSAFAGLTSTIITGMTAAIGLFSTFSQKVREFVTTTVFDALNTSELERAAELRSEVLDLQEKIDVAVRGSRSAQMQVPGLQSIIDVKLAELEAIEGRLNVRAGLVGTTTTGTPATPGGPIVAPVAPPTEEPLTGLAALTDEQLQAQIERLTMGLATEEEAMLASYQRRSDILTEALARDANFKETHDELEKRNEAEKAAFFLARDEELAEAKMKVAQSVLDFGIGLAKDGSKLERGLLAIKKAIAIREAMINLQAAMSKAMNTPWPANILAIAQVAAIGAGIVGTLQGVNTSVPSFEGGGFTGDGPRAGGIDGRGGFVAMLHPNETVVDNTSGAGGGNTYDFRGSELSEARVIELIEQANLMQDYANADLKGRGRR